MTHELYLQKESCGILRLIKGGIVVVDAVDEVLPRIVLEPLRKIRRGTTEMNINIRGEKLLKMIGQVTTETAKGEQNSSVEDGESLTSLRITGHRFALLLILLLHDDLDLTDVKVGFITGMSGKEHFERFSENAVALILDMAYLKKFGIPGDGSGKLEGTAKRIPKSGTSEDGGVSKIGSILFGSQKSDTLLNGGGESGGIILTETVEQRKEERIGGMKGSIGGTNQRLKGREIGELIREKPFAH
jgi:hypothetical protein